MSNANRASLIREGFGSYIAEKDQVNVCIKCPKCGKQGSEKKKLVIKIDDGKFHCWVCGLKGSNIQYLFSRYCPRLLQKAIKIFQVTSHVSLFDKLDDIDDIIPIDLRHDLFGFIFLGDVHSNTDPDVRAVLKYAKNRGITKSKMWKYRLGACTNGRMKRRLIVPSFDKHGNLNYYSAREIDKLSRMKYINAPISKKEIIFNEFIIDWSKPITLVEGPLDAVFGGDNAVCLLGSHLAHDSLILKKIVENNTKTYIALDADAPDKSEKISKMLSSFGIEVKEVKLPVGLDIADIGEKKLNELRLTSLCWTKESSILRKIYSMKSGSIL